MSEKMYLPEANEPIDRDDVVLLLRLKGPEDQYVKTLLGKWIDQMQKMADDLWTVGKKREVDVDVRNAIELARLYLDAGLTQEAKTAFRDAYELAYQLGNDALADAIKREMEGLGL